MAGFIRRRTILTCLACAVTSALAVPAGAQSSGPLTKPIELIAPASPGGGWDTTARAFQASARDA